MKNFILNVAAWSVATPVILFVLFIVALGTAGYWLFRLLDWALTRALLRRSVT